MVIFIFLFQIVVGYKKPKYFHLTPSRKKLGRILGRGNRGSLSKVVLENGKLRKQVVQRVGKLIQKEMQMICSEKFNSIMRDTSDVAMEHFSWESIWIELNSKAPTFLSVVESALPTKTKLDKKPMLCMIAGMLAKFRNPKMCLVQAVVSLLLKSGHAGSQVSSLYCIVRCVNLLKVVSF